MQNTWLVLKKIEISNILLDFSSFCSISREKLLQIKPTNYFETKIA